jgi:hypothetical protein
MQYGVVLLYQSKLQVLVPMPNGRLYRFCRELKGQWL